MKDLKKSVPDNRSAFSIAKPGHYFIIAAVIATVVFSVAGVASVAFAGLVITVFIGYFFRDPDRVAPMEEGAVVSPADGRVIIAKPVDENPFIEGKCIKISIFMSVFNVHVNRIPAKGRISGIVYNPGRFFSANLNKASEQNENSSITVDTDNGHKVVVVQIAGLIARRIVCWVKAGDDVVAGQRFGLIRFGSRVDIYLPDDSRVNVRLKERVKAGESVIGYLPWNKEEKQIKDERIL